MLVAGLATSPVAVQLLEEDDRSVLRLQEELTVPVAAGIRHLLGDLVRAELLVDGPVVLDLVAVERAERGALEVLADTSAYLRRNGRALLLRNLRRQPRHMRHLLRLESALALERG